MSASIQVLPSMKIAIRVFLSGLGTLRPPPLDSDLDIRVYPGPPRCQRPVIRHGLIRPDPSRYPRLDPRFSGSLALSASSISPPSQHESLAIIRVPLSETDSEIRGWPGGGPTHWPAPSPDAESPVTVGPPAGL